MGDTTEGVRAVGLSVLVILSVLANTVVVGSVAVATAGNTATDTETSVEQTDVAGDSDNWAVFGHDAASTRANAGATGVQAPVVQQWAVDLGAAVWSSPAAVDGTVYVGSLNNNNTLYALDDATGTAQWRFQTGGRVYSSPAVTNDTVYVGSGDGNLYAVNATDGTERWRFGTGDEVLSSPVVADGTVYVGSDDGNLYALNATDGTEQWRFSTGAGVESSPAVADGTVYVGSDDSNLYAVDAETGAEQWRFGTGDVIGSSPAVAGGTVYVGSDDSNLYAVDAETGAEQWRFSTSYGMWSSPAVANGTVYVGSDDSNLYAIDATDGTEQWRFETLSDVYPSPAVANGTVYVGSWDDNVYAVNATDGTERWRFQTSDAIRSSPAVVNGSMYVGGWNKMYALTTEGISYSNLSVSKTSVATGESVDVSATVSNAGATSHEYTANLTRDGSVVTGRTGTLAAGESTRVSFTTTIGTAGSYDVTIDSLSPRTVTVYQPPGVVTGTDWPSFGSDLSSSGHTAGTAGVRAPIERRWVSQVAGFDFPMPVVAGETLYIGNEEDGNLYAFNATDGSQRWTVDLGVAADSPTVAGDTVYIGSSINGDADGKFYAINRTDGSIRWSVEADNYGWTAPAVANGTVYVGTDWPETTFFALNASDGTQQWYFKGQDDFKSPPAVANGTVYVVVDDYNLSALDAATGTEQWAVSIGEGAWSAPTVTNGTVYVGSSTPDAIKAIDAATGSVQWRVDTSAPETSSMAVANGTVYTGPGSVVTARDADTGTQQWTFDTGMEDTATPSVVGGSVYVAADNGYSSSTTVYALDAETGTEQWQYTLDEPLVDLEEPVITDGTLYLALDRIHALTGVDEIQYGNLSVPESVIAGATANVSVTVSNVATGTRDYTAELVVDGAVAATRTGSLDAGSTTNITFEHTFAESGNATVSIDDLRGTTTVTPSPVANVTTSRYIGSVPLGDTVSTSVSIRNEGRVPLAVGPTAVSGENASAFSLSSVPDIVPADGQRAMTVTFTPETGGRAVATVAVETNDTSATSQAVTVGAIGREPSVAVSTDDIDFGNVTVGDTATASVVVANNGTGPMAVDPSVTGPYGITSTTETVLAPGESRIVDVTTSGLTDGSNSGTLTVATNASRDPTVALRATGQVPALDIRTATPLQFPDTPVGSTRTASVTLANTGDATLVVDLSNAFDTSDSQFTLAGDTDRYEVEPGQTRTVEVAFSPATTTATTGTLTVETNDGGASGVQQDVSLEGTGIESDLSTATSSLGLGSVGVGGMVTKTVSLTNDGSVTVTDLSASVSGSGSDQFDVGSLPDSLDESTTVPVTFTPTRHGDAVATLNVSGESQTGTAYATVSLSGTATPPDVELGSETARFGYVDEDSATSTASVTVRNTGPATTTLNVSSVSLTGSDADAFAVDARPAAIGGGDSGQVDLRFDPSSVGEHSATLGVRTSDPDEPTRQVELVGHGTAPNATVSTSTLSLGTVGVGETETRSVTVESTGGVPVNLTDVSLTGTDADQVSVTSDPTATGAETLVPGATATIEVAVTPTTGGDLDASLSLSTTDDSPSGPVTLDVTATAPNVTTTPENGSTIDFGETSVGSAAQRILTVTNDGAATLALPAPTVTGHSAFSVTSGQDQVRLSPGETETYVLAYAPETATDRATATLAFGETSDPDVDRLAYTLEGTAVEADATLSDASVGLGQVDVGETNTTGITLRNEGGAALSIDQVSITGGNASRFSTDLSTGTLRAGESRSFTVSVTPERRGALSGRLVVETSDGWANSSLGATGVAPEIDAGDGEIDLSATRLGQSRVWNVAINNTGNQALDIEDVSITGEHSDQFRMLNAPDTVAAKASGDAKLQFRPTDVDAAKSGIERSAQLTIESNDTDEGTLQRPLSGLGITPDLRRSERALQTGTVVVGERVTRTVEIRNDINGTAPLRVTDTAISGPGASAFALEGELAGTTLRPGESETVTVEYAPSRPGATFATLSVLTNDTRERGTVISLTNTDTLVEVVFGSVHLDYTDPEPGLQPEMDIYNGEGTNASYDSIAVAADTSEDFEVDLTEQDTVREVNRAGVTPLRYFEGTTTTSAFTNATIGFRVEKSALADLGVTSEAAARDAVALYRHDGSEYRELTTEYERETSESYVFTATATSLSNFVIGVKEPLVSVQSGPTISETNVTTGESVTVTATVDNDGPMQGSTDVTLDTSEATLASTSVTVDGDSSETVTFQPTFGTRGTYDLTVNGHLAGTVTVTAPTSTKSSQTTTSGSGNGGGGGGGGGGGMRAPAVLTIRTAASDSPVLVGDNVTVTVTASNAGDQTGTVAGPLRIDGQSQRRETFDVPGGSTVRETYTLSFETTGRHTFAIGESVRQTVVVTNSLSTSVTVRPDGNATVADITNAQATEPVSITPSQRRESVGLSELTVGFATGGDYSLRLTSSTSAPDDRTRAGALGYVEVDHAAPERAIESTSLDVRVSNERLDEQDVAADAVTLYRYHDGQWNPQPTSVRERRASTSLFSTNATGLSTFAIGPRQSGLVVTDVALPTTAGSDTETTITATVENRGETTASRTVGVRADGDTIVTETVTLDAGETRQVSLTHGLEVGQYDITVNGTAGGTLDVAAQSESAAPAIEGQQPAQTTESAGVTSSSDGPGPGVRGTIVALGIFLLLGRRRFGT